MGLLNARSVSNKTFILNNLITSEQIDFMFLTETWLKESDGSQIVELCPPSHQCLSLPRQNGRGGGVALVFNKYFKCQLIPTSSFSSFGLLAAKIGSAPPILCLLVYRPPKLSPCFIDEFSDMLSSMCLASDKIILLGDFNFHVDNPANRAACEFLELTSSFGLRQHVLLPTHSHGHTLDLVFTTGLDTRPINLINPGVSDHMCVLFDTTIDHETQTQAHLVRSRYLCEESVPRFSSLFQATSPSSNNTDVDTLVANFNLRCISTLDAIAPLKTKTKSRAKLSPWLNKDIRSLKRECRKTERRWKKSGLQVHLAHLKSSLKAYNKLVREARSKYFSELIKTNKSNPRVLFNTVDRLLNPSNCTEPAASKQECLRFQKFFNEKVSNIRTGILTPLSPDDVPLLKVSPDRRPSHSTLDHFTPITSCDLMDIVSSMKPSSCPGDVIPPKFLPQVLHVVAPHLVSIINCSLSSGSVPNTFKVACIHPLLKKPGLDPSSCSNYRPISKLPFISKILEKYVSKQLIAALTNNQIFEQFQSGFRKHHSTETALLKVTNDLLMSADVGDVSVLVLLDLTAAFDTVDHSILVNRLQRWCGVSGTALQWFSSYLSNRFCYVSIGEHSSPPSPLNCGVPQGSVLGPILFSIYMLPLGNIIRKHGISFHCYADDTQLYLPVKPNNLTELSRLSDCLTDIKSWMSTNFLQLNSNKTEILIIGPEHLHSQVASCLGPLSDKVKPVSRNLGVVFDSNLTLENHVSGLTRTCFYHLRNISRIRSMLSFKDCEIIVHAFISSRLDYCNSVLTCLSQKSLHRLQLVQNAAARLLTGSRKREHITPILASLHWLPVSHRIDFKILLITYKAFHGLAPSYIQELLTPYTPIRNLRSSSGNLLAVPKSRLKSRGDAAFAVRAPRLWNDLPEELRLANSLSSFKSMLKTHLYRKAFYPPA